MSGNWFRDPCRAARCPGSAHGLRKAGAARAAENGATTNQLMARFGWSSERMALLCTRKADRKRLAAAAGALLERNTDKAVAPPRSGATRIGNKGGAAKA
jgi:integrase